MNYASPEVLVDTEWVSKNPPSEKVKLVEVDYDPENGYRKGYIVVSILFQCQNINNDNWN